MKIFLGGTCNGSKWREAGFIPNLEPGIDVFNPVVDDWNDEAKKRELYERKHCDFCLYVITPLINGVYSIAEAIDDSHLRPKKTVFCIHNADFLNYENISEPPINKAITKFSVELLKNLVQVGLMIRRNGGYYFNSLKESVWFFNSIINPNFLP